MRKIFSVIILTVMTLPFTAFNAAVTTSVQTTGPLADGTLTVGMECNYAPNNWTVPAGTAVNTAVPIKGSKDLCDGFDVQIARKIAEDLGVKLEVAKIPWDGLIPALQSNTIDAIIAGMSPTLERQKTVDFSNPYYINRPIQKIIVKADSKYANATNLEDFKGAGISAQLGTLQEGLVTQVPERKEVSSYEDYNALMQATLAGTIDGYIAEAEVASQQVVSNDKLKLVDFAEGQGFVLSEEDTNISIGIKKGNEDFVNQINGALGKISDDERSMLMNDAKERINGEDQSDNAFVTLISKFGSFYVKGLSTTLLLAFFGTILGTCAGALLAVLRTLESHYKDSAVKKVLKKIVRLFAIAYIDIFRGTPMIVQSMVIYYGPITMFNQYLKSTAQNPETVFQISAIAAGIMILTLNTAAYIAEIIRSGILSIDKGQMEAARSLGLSHKTSMIKIVLPQALKNTIPALMNELIVNIKDSSVLSVIAVNDLFYQGKAAASSNYFTFESYLIVAAIYLVTTMTLTKLITHFVNRNHTNKKNVSFPTSQTTSEVI
ncbi:MAG: ABC transporter substrate-binding protein/permease [Mycoplasmatales bacterium]